jgi:geranyl-CoA carboxylase alpha subunit
MVAKFIAHGHDRADAVRRLVRALEDAPLLGLKNNGRFLRDLVRHPQFAASTLTTTRLDEWAAEGEALLQRAAPSEAAWRVAAALLGQAATGRPKSVAGFDLALECDGVKRTLRAPPSGIHVLSNENGELRLVIDGVQRRALAVTDGDTLHLSFDGFSFGFREPSPYPRRDTAADPRRARAPVAGVVAQVLVTAGDRVAAGQPLICVEAMKMEMWLNAAAAGTVRAVNVKARDPVASGAVLVELEIQE